MDCRRIVHGSKHAFLVCIAVLLLSLWAASARADDALELYLEGGLQDIPSYGHQEVHGTVIGTELRLLPSSWRGFSTMLGYDFRSRQARSAYAGGGYRFDLLRNLFFEASAGGANYTRGNGKELGSRWLFYLSGFLGYHIDRHWILSAGFDHMSNAGLATPNPGISDPMIRLGFAF